MIMVYAEVLNGVISDITYEILRKAREIADHTEEEVVTVVMGYNVDLKYLGASDRIIYVEDERLKNFALHRYVLEKIIDKYSPRIILIGNTSIGMDLIGGQPCIISCYDFNDSVKSISYGGKVFIESKLDRGILLINRGSFEPLRVEKEVKVERLSLDELGVKVDIELVEIIRPEVEDVDISKAEIVVGVGRGAQNIIDVAEELAKILNGVVGASRPVIDQGLLPRSRQVGRSGKTISPKLYLALGISGAMEHIEGVKAKNVIAINKDKNAPIFRISRYGVVGDVEEIVPLLLERLRS